MSKQTDINWLHYYGSMRMVGRPVREAIAVCNSPDEAAASSFDRMLVASGQLSAARAAEVVAVKQRSKSMANAIPVLGVLVSAVATVVGWISKAVAEGKEWGCESRCKTYDRRNLIPLCPPPIGYYQKDMGYIAWFSHDGLVVYGPGLPDSEDLLGGAVGVTGYYEESCAKVGRETPYEVNERYRTGKIVFSIPPSGLARGSSSTPWKNHGDNW